MIEGVLFDFDGVLVPLVETHAHAFREALRVHGAPTHSPGGLVEAELNGLSTREKLRRLTQRGIVRADQHESIWKAKQDLTLEAIRQTVRPDYAKTVMLETLRSIGFKIACVSNSIFSTTDLALRCAEIRHLFDFVLTNEDAPRQKPYPDPYLEAFRRYGLLADRFLIVEDSPHGVESARRSGAFVLVVGSYKDVTLVRIEAAIREHSTP